MSTRGRATLSVESAQQIAVPVSHLESVRQRHALVNPSGASLFPSTHTGRDGWGPRPLSRSPLSPECIPAIDHHGEHQVSGAAPIGPQLSGVPDPTHLLPLSAGCFRPGSAFPFLSAPSLAALSSLPSSPPPPPPCSSSTAAAGRSSLLGSKPVGFFNIGSPFPFLPSCPTVQSSPTLLPSVGTWISSKGGRSKFVSWLAAECDRLLEEDWRGLDPDTAWSLLNDAGWSDQTELLLSNCRFVDPPPCFRKRKDCRCQLSDHLSVRKGKPLLWSTSPVALVVNVVI